MIGIDTNILIRTLTGDDEKQLKKVHELFKQHPGNGEIFVSIIVIIETFWVLKSVYKWTLSKYLSALEDMLSCPEYNIEHSQAVRMTISRCKKGESFVDALIGQIGTLKNIKTYTFDNDLKNDSAFIVLKD